MAVKHFSVDYKTINEHGTFSAGDTITGRSLFIKAKGKAEVKWTENEGQNPVAYSGKKKYFSLQILLQEGKGDGSEIISPGRHVYPFTFQIPAREMPSSYMGKWGKITYYLKAKLIRTLWLIDRAKTEFTYLSKTNMIIPGLRVKCSYYPSCFLNYISIKILVEIHNNSTCTVTPNFYLYEEQSFFAKHKRNIYTNDIIKERGDPVTASTRQTVTKVLTIPPQLPVSLLDCSILKLEYRLKVTLDVPTAKDPEVKLPLVILLDKSIAAEERQQEYSWSK
uniref:Arrestin C-terminal-like domain-containing protein n=1 Tax=Oncorhynchus tshawytscha TaxID=74940 RepID=A0A8C8D6Q8_ONCTS